MNPLHVVVAAFNLLCLLALVGALVLGAGSVRESLLSLAAVGGYFANLVALLVSAILLVLLVIRAFSRGARSTLRAHWLGIVNGEVVILAWVLYFALGSLRP